MLSRRSAMYEENRAKDILFSLSFSMQKLPKECLIFFTFTQLALIYKGTGHFLSASFREISFICFSFYNYAFL